MATVMQMYKAGKSLFDHSFQGKQVSLGNMSRFMSVNAKILRSQIAADVAAGTTNCTVVSPGAVSPVPNVYRISEGTFPQGLFSVAADSSNIRAQSAGNAQAMCSEFYTPGDIYTIVAIGISGTATAADKISPATVFGYVRLVTKQTLPNKLVAEAKPNEVFDIETYNCSYDGNTAGPASLTLSTLFGSGITKGAMGVIHSREDSGLRSTCDMVTSETIAWGVVPANIPEVWNAATNPLGQSELILEGGEAL